MAADKPKNIKKEPGVMDITKPGKQAPPSTSKPVIVGHRPMVADPMVKEDKPPAEESDSEEHKITVNRVGPKIIAPLSDGEISDDKTDEKAEDKTTEETEDKPEEPAEEKPSEEDDKVDLKEEEPEEAPPYIIEDQNAPDEKSDDKSDDKSEEKPEEKDEPEEKSDDKSKEDESKDEKSDESSEEKSEDKPAEGSDAAVVDAVADQAGSKKKEENAETEEEKQKREAVEKLIEDKKYYVPTSVVTKKRRTRWLFVFLILLVFGLASYIMVDASTNTKLPYEFFKDEAAKDSVATYLPDTIPTPTTTEEKPQFKLPAGWTKKQAKNIGLSFALPASWTYTDHAESQCTKGYYLEVEPSAETIAKAAEATGNPNLKKANISITAKSSITNCGDFTDDLGIAGSPYMNSASLLSTGIFAKNSVTMFGDAETGVQYLVVTKKAYKPGDTETNGNARIGAGEKMWVIKIALDSGQYEQMITPQKVSATKYVSTDLYKDTVKVLSSIELL